MRALKSRLRSLDAPAVPADLTMALLRMSEPGGPLPPRVRPFEPAPAPGYGGYGAYGLAPHDNRPRRDGGASSGPGRPGRRRAAYVAVGVASAAVALGTLFVTAGGSPRPVTPPVEMFANQHRATVEFNQPASVPVAPTPTPTPGR